MSEKRLNARDGGKLIPNSGRGRLKGDSIIGPFLNDYKENTSTYTLTKKAWLKHASDAWEQGHREPLVSVVLDGEVRVAIIDWDTFTEMRKITYGVG